jgi:O-antigen ligase
MKLISTLLRPQFWLYLLAGLLPFERIPAIPLLGFHLRPSLAVALILVVITLAHAPRLLIPKRPYHWLLYLFLAICTLSSLLSAHPGRALRITAYTILSVVLALCIASLIRKINLRTLGLILLISSVVVSVFGFYQFVADLAGISGHLTGLKSMYSSQVFGFPRIQAASLEPLYFGNYLLLAISILAGIGLVAGINVTVLTVLYTALLLTLSRGAVGAVAIASIIILSLALYKRRYKDSAELGLAIIVAFILTFCALTYVVPALHNGSHKISAFSVYSNHVTDVGADSSNVDRTRTRKLAEDAFMSNPILGVGPGTYGYYAAAHANYSKDQIVNNEPFELLAETGILGFLSFVAFALALGLEGVKSLLKRDNDLLTRAVLFGALVYLIGTAIQYWSFSTLYIIQVWFAIGLVMGLSEDLPKLKKKIKS